LNSVIFVAFLFIAVLSLIFVIIEILARPSLKHVFFGLIAIIMGLMIGTLLSDPLSKLPDYYGEYLPLVVSIIFAFAGLMLYRKMIPAIDHWLEQIAKGVNLSGIAATLGIAQQHSLTNDIIVDTSALIDGRVVSIARLGYLPQRVLLPRFILAEMQNIADSKDSDRRNKGKRGLSNIEDLKKLKGVDFRVVPDDFSDITEVDHKLVALSHKLHAQLLTTDFNLNKVATAESIRVLNVNELAQEMRPLLLPGDQITVRLVHLGKDKNQGVGYLEDGTMLVVENASNMLTKEALVTVSRSLQTAAGKMYFAKIRKNK
jgi:uncharacterized protein YacL